MHSAGARMYVKTQPDLVGRRENAARAWFPTFPHWITGWKSPARAPGSQLGAFASLNPQTQQRLIIFLLAGAIIALAV